MITIRKLSRQNEEAILRKSAGIFWTLQYEAAQTGEGFPDRYERYIHDLASLLLSNSLLDEQSEKLIAVCRDTSFRNLSPRETEFLLSDVYHGLKKLCGGHVGDWDLTWEERKGERHTLPMKVYLDRVRSPFNVGSVFRTAESFGVEEILLHPSSASPLHPRAQRSSMGCIERIPWRFAEEWEISGDLFALETGGTLIQEFQFPDSATVVVGSEELGVSPQLLDKTDRSLGRISIPTAGEKGSLNLSVAFGILAFSWYQAIASRPVQ